MFLAREPQRYAGQRVGNGHCAVYVQAVSDVGRTAGWRRGRKVRGGDVPAGAIIATFGADGRYTNRDHDASAHAAVLISERADGLLVWDQWIGRPVGQRVLRFRGGRGDAVNDGDAFHVVELEA